MVMWKLSFVYEYTTASLFFAFLRCIRAPPLSRYSVFFCDAQEPMLDPLKPPAFSSLLLSCVSAVMSVCSSIIPACLTWRFHVTEAVRTVLPSALKRADAADS